MSKNINFNEKGITNVKNSDTILRTPNAFDVNESTVAKSGKGEWSDFEAFNNESRYISPKLKGESSVETLRRARRVLGRAALLATS